MLLPSGMSPRLLRPETYRYRRAASKPKYVANALAALAERNTSPINKRRLLRLADGWLDLAERAQKVLTKSSSKVPEHPLERAKLGDEHTAA
jgi:hypothetical protein